MAKQVGVSPAILQRIWPGRGLKSHLVKTFKRSSDDPVFEENLIEAVGLNRELHGLSQREPSLSSGPPAQNPSYLRFAAAASHSAKQSVSDETV